MCKQTRKRQCNKKSTKAQFRKCFNCTKLRNEYFTNTSLQEDNREGGRIGHPCFLYVFALECTVSVCVCSSQIVSHNRAGLCNLRTVLCSSLIYAHLSLQQKVAWEWVYDVFKVKLNAVHKLIVQTTDKRLNNISRFHFLLQSLRRVCST